MTDMALQKMGRSRSLGLGIIHLPDREQIVPFSQDGSPEWNWQTEERIANWRDGGSALRTIALSVDGREWLVEVMTVPVVGY